MHADESPPELPLRLAAALVALASTGFMVWLLMRIPSPLPPAQELDVVLIERIAPAPRAVPESASVPEFESESQSEPMPQRTSPRSDASATDRAPATPARPAAANPSPANGKAAPAARLYTAEGRPALAADPDFDPIKRKAYAPGSDEDPNAAKVRNAFERKNPLPSQGGGFDGWASDGTLGEAFVESAQKRLQKIVDKLPGRKQVQEVVARPPPPVRFNPALHERPSDLGSEATGDAYKAAPIAFERAPGLGGQASARIRAAIGELEQRRRGCDLERLRTLLAPALSGLDELQRIERAYASGADPVSAEQLLPRSADLAYDRARRAIWYADQRSADCAKP
ncbi:hypothetical protein [Lysobacter enzymogenes]|uniref:hypothetical protein n=1 Tax=Lysobacter enzymogenes TaxID=69 RepID=UPI001AF64869|nr:hypothetical protein [Lysobacter enzymogenes]QQP99279.1 hypothetical protein JHW41_14205 [Lysobacter enzymogenes]